MDDEEETELSRVDSWMQSTVPSIPRFFAMICLVLNIVIPGLGTFFGGMFSCCCGRPRIEFRPAQYRCPVAVLVMFIGILQFLSTGFFLVGWLWSIIWGFLMVNLSGEEFRKMAPPPAVVLEKVAGQRRASKVSIQIEESAPAGKKNFSKLINKASENKDLALRGSGSTASISKDPKDSKGPKDKLAPEELHAGKLGLPNTASDPKASSSKSASSTPSKDSLGQASTPGPSSIFSCFGQRPKRFITEKLEKFLIRGHSESTSDLLGAMGTIDTSAIKSTAHRLFRHWRGQARKLTLDRLKRVAGNSNHSGVPPILVSPQSSIRDSAGTPNSVRFVLPTEDGSSTVPPAPRAADVQGDETVILDPSKLESGRNNPRITVAHPLPDNVADDASHIPDDMKPRITHSQTYHFEV